MQQSGRGNSWIGWLIFIFLVFGSRFLPPLANWLTQVTGVTVTPPMLIVAVIALSVVGSIVGAVARQAGRARSANDTRLPTPPTLSPPSDMGSPRLGQPSRPAAPPAQTQLPRTSTRLPPARLPSGEQRLPTPPRFEPIIDPRVLTFGILGLLALGAFLLVVLFLAGALP
jgi:hypothetical protein